MDSTQVNSTRQPISVKLWPPSENTRLKLVERMATNLSTPTFFTQKYGTLSKEEALENAKSVEEVAFTIANQHYENEPDGDGSFAVQLYAKECSKLILEVHKKGSETKKDADVPMPLVAQDREIKAEANVPTTDVAQDEEIKAEENVPVSKETEIEADVPKLLVTQDREIKADANVPTPGVVQDEEIKAEESVPVSKETETEADVPMLFVAQDREIIAEANVPTPDVVQDEEIKAEENEPVSLVAQGECFDISKGTRAFIEIEEAEQILRPLKEAGNSYTKICFSNRSFGLEAARVAEPILASLKGHLTDVDLSDFIAGRPEAEALEVMTIFAAALEGSALRSLDLSNNALGEKGVRAFGALLKSQSSLEELYLMNDGISEEAARAICELVPSTEKLRVLHFHNNMTGDAGAVAIAEVVKRSKFLEDFRCSSTRVDCEGGIALSEALESCAHLSKLDLRDNMFGVEAGKALSKSLLKHANLKEIYLSYLNLENEGAIAILDALKNSAPNLEVLEIAGNEISTVAVPALKACLEQKQYLTRLVLSENELKDEGALQIAKSLEEGHTHLKELDMSSNSIRRVGARMLAQIVVQKPEFKLLNIDGNFISDEGIDDVKDIFKKCAGMLGPLDENDPEGGDEEEGDDEEDKDHAEETVEDSELESKMKKLEVDEDE